MTEHKRSDSSPETRQDRPSIPGGVRVSVQDSATGKRFKDSSCLNCENSICDECGPLRPEILASEAAQMAIDNVVNHPPHYDRGDGMECIDFLEALVARFPGPTGLRLGNVGKYIWRHLDKGDPLENLKKARWYLDREIQKLEEARLDE